MPIKDFVFTFEDTEIRASLPFFSQFACAIPRHSHSMNSYEIHYIPSGSGTVRISGKDYLLTPGTLYVTGPYVDHEQIPDSSNPMSEYCVYLQLTMHKKPASGNRPVLSVFEATPFWFGQDCYNIEPVLKLMIQELNDKMPGYRHQVISLLRQVIVIMIRNYEDCGHLPLTDDNSHMYDPYLYIEQCFLYRYNDITLDGLASDIGLSSRQTERLLKQNYNMNFRQKKHEAKMSAAKVMLYDKNLSITDIAQRLDYSSVGHFSTSFKNYYGMTPNEFRKNQ